MRKHKATPRTVKADRRDTGFSPPEDCAVPAGEKRPEHGGPGGPEPTRYGDWERNGKCVDF